MADDYDVRRIVRAYDIHQVVWARDPGVETQEDRDAASSVLYLDLLDDLRSDAERRAEEAWLVFWKDGVASKIRYWKIRIRETAIDEETGCFYLDSPDAVVGVERWTSAYGSRESMLQAWDEEVRQRIRDGWRPESIPESKEEIERRTRALRAAEAEIVDRNVRSASRSIYDARFATLERPDHVKE